MSQSTFQRCVARYRGEYKASRFSCWERALARVAPPNATPGRFVASDDVLAFHDRL